jgi:hypothetical protein
MFYDEIAESASGVPAVAQNNDISLLTDESSGVLTKISRYFKLIFVPLL